MKKSFLFFLFLLLVRTMTFGQTDPVLFTVAGKPVHLSEFNYIYTKTNGSKADFSRASVEEYLDLYTKFKMKVARAKEMQLDTIPSLQEELAGYRRQLADSYLTDKEVTEKLIKEAYDRMQKDVSVSHILVRVERNDTVAAWNIVNSIKQKLNNGSDFETTAKELSQDPNTQKNGGLLGYLTATLPDGFYELENAMYNTPVGKSSDVIRSPIGYHIIKVNAVRPARGEIEVAHIMFRKSKDGIPQLFAKQKADSVYNELKRGSSFETMALQLSDDGNSNAKGGYLGFFGIGRYEIAFEDVAFSLANDGDISAAVESSIGWHIIKRISRKGIQPYDVMKSRLKASIQQDSRFDLAKKAMIGRIKRENNFKDTPSVLAAMIKQLDSTFLTFSWKKPDNVSNQELFTLGNTPYTTSNFADYLVTNANRRLSYAVSARNDLGAITKMMYDDYINENVLAFEETQLENKYSDFKNLMREYEEGILLFEAIKMNVWDKASLDSLGLEKFHQTRRDKYMWNERAQIITYMISDSIKSDVEKIHAFAIKNDVKSVLKKFNKKKNYITFSEETVEKDKNKALQSLNWKANSTTKPELETTDKTWRFYKIDKIMPATPKTLKEARGFVVADYQEFLEKQWMDDLVAKYKVEINQSVLKSIIK